MSEQQLNVAKVAIARAATVSEVARGVPPRINLSVDIKNTGAESLHVWTSVQAFEYDAATRTLTVQLAKRTVQAPPGIKIISTHPRIPQQVEVKPNSTETINIEVPGSIRRLTPGRGLGQSFEEDPVGPIDLVNINIQYGTEPVQAHPREDPIQVRERLRAHGDVVQISIKPTGDTGSRKPTTKKTKG